MLMAKEMKYKEISRNLAAAGAHVLRDGKGSHVVWACCAAHSVGIPQHAVSPGVVRQVQRALVCIPKEAIQK